ncbi:MULTISPECIES: Tfp pilus assembly protein FimT/FimU [Psychrobacter]|uniref:pilus assembly FimT family protein n=1 Tax=Psychrobacter TaxID=497 RepID=UPI00097EE3C9|nr:MULTISPECIES: prepilin-type N-terminal cleavage/methylation domain-containing protein [Psychrobacter]SJN44105.1 Type IV fimbrial biogenesis protein FimT [Psychrobacter sp. JB385]
MNASANNLPLKQKMTSSGFTLIELMVTIAVLAIIVSIAAPSISTQLANQRVKSTAAIFENALKEAKVESVVRRQPLEFSFDNSKQSILIKSKNAGGSSPIESYTYNSKSIIKASKTSITFFPSKRAEAVTYTICDSEKSSIATQVIVTAVANITTVAGGSC